MLKEEFIKRTGFEPTDAEYAEIEERYYNFNGDKDAFCKDFSENGFSAMIKERKEKIEKLQADLLERDNEIKRLQSELEKEMEWKPCTTVGTNIEQDEYEIIKLSAGRVLTDYEAKQIIYDEFGFAPAKVEIIHTVSTYEVNRHHRLREADEFYRQAVYDVSDYNYIRFDCSDWCYEMINGELKRYY